MIEIAGVLSAMRAAMDLAKAGLEARDDAKVKAAIGELAEKFTDLQLKTLAMSEHLSSIESEMREKSAQLRDAQDTIKKRDLYVLREVRQGAYVYAFEPVEGSATPAHYKCQICFDSGKDSVLVESLNGNTLYCRIEKTHNVFLRTDRINVNLLR